MSFCYIPAEALRDCGRIDTTTYVLERFIPTQYHYFFSICEDHEVYHFIFLTESSTGEAQFRIYCSNAPYRYMHFYVGRYGAGEHDNKSPEWLLLWNKFGFLLETCWANMSDNPHTHPF